MTALTLSRRLEALETRLSRMEGKGGIVFGRDALVDVLERAGLRADHGALPVAIDELYRGHGEAFAAWREAGLPWPCLIVGDDDLDL